MLKIMPALSAGALLGIRQVISFVWLKAIAHLYIYIYNADIL